MDSSSRTLVAVVLAATALAPRPSFAQAGAADTQLARQLGNEGLELASSGDCAGAVEKLTRAEGLHHAPTTLTVLGECHITLGALVEGVEELTRVVREDLGRSPPPAFRKAQIRARQKLDAARPRVPKLKLNVEGASADSTVAIRLDGQSIPQATLGLERPMDPGEHQIEVSAVGYKNASAHVQLKEGASQSLTLTLEALPAALSEPTSVSSPPPGPPPPVARERDEAPPPPAVTKGNYLPGGLLLGVGTAWIGVGAVLGIVTLNKASRLNAACQPRSDCPASEQSDIDSAKTVALGSTIAFAIGVVGVGLGTYFLVDPPSKTEKSASAGGVKVQPWIGPGSAGLTGSF